MADSHETALAIKEAFPMGVYISQREFERRLEAFRDLMHGTEEKNDIATAVMDRLGWIRLVPRAALLCVTKENNQFVVKVKFQ